MTKCAQCGRGLGLVESSHDLCARCRIHLRHIARDLALALAALDRLKPFSGGRAQIRWRRLEAALRAVIAACAERGGDPWKAL